MKKWIIVSICLGVLVIIGVSSLFIFLNDSQKVNKTNENIGSNIVPDEKDDLGNNNSYLMFNIDIDEYFVNEILNIKNCFISNDFSLYDVKVNTESEDIVINNFEIISKNSGKQNFSVYYKFKNEMDYTLLKSFSILFYDKISKFEPVLTSLAINKYKLSYNINSFIDFNCIKYCYDKNNISIFSNKNDNRSAELILELKDSLSSDFKISYCKTILNISDNFEVVNQLKQNYEDYFSVRNITTQNNMTNSDVLNLKLINESINYDKDCSFNEFKIIEGLVISNINYIIEFNNSIIDILEINNVFKIIAKNKGTTKIAIKYNSIELINFTVNVDYVEIETANSGSNQFSCELNEQVNIAPIEILPKYAFTKIEYVCDNKSASIVNGVFSASEVGEFKILITINNNFAYNVVVNVIKKEIVQSQFYLTNASGEKINTLPQKMGQMEYYSLNYTDLKISDLIKTNGLICLIDSAEKSDVINFNVLDNDLLSIKFNKIGNYELIFKIKNTEIVSNKIILKVD